MKRELIVKLADEAHFYVEGNKIFADDCFDSIDRELTDFAELIIRDCIDACYKANEIRNIVPPTQEQVVLWCIDEIEKKFGVKS